MTKRIFLLLAVLLLFPIGVASQDSNATLIDKFDRAPCSDIRGRTDVFLAELAGDPESIGYVVVSGSVEFPQALARRALFENHIVVRNFDRNRVRYVRKAGLGEYGVEFWKVRPGSSLPIDAEPDWDYKISGSTRPRIIYTARFHESECLYPSGSDVLFDYLKANPGARSNIVVRCKGKGCFDEARVDLRKELVELGVEIRPRIRFFYVPIRDFYWSIEFWILP